MHTINGSNYWYMTSADGKMVMESPSISTVIIFE